MKLLYIYQIAGMHVGRQLAADALLNAKKRKLFCIALQILATTYMSKKGRRFAGDPLPTLELLGTRHSIQPAKFVLRSCFLISKIG